jgi:hypothetical protein
MSSKQKLLRVAAALISLSVPSLASAQPQCDATADLIVTGLEGGSGSAIGPGGALYVTEAVAGRISRIDPRTGEVTTFATGLPTRVVGTGGAMDLAFVGHTAYVLVTLVGPDVGGSDVVGIYRMDGPDTFTVIADIGAFALANPPENEFFVPTGVQYALETYRGGFLVTDGHHDRVLQVSRDGEVGEFMAFENDNVPTGLAVRGNTIYMAEAGPVPHLPEAGKVVSFGPKSSDVTEVASGASLLVDVESGRGGTLYALSQGDFSGGPAGAPALPNTGALVQVNGDGTFTVLVEGLDRPTSLEVIQNTAYVVTLTGEIWNIEGLSCPPYGVSH